MNHKTDAFVDYDSFPVIGNDGLILWKTPLEFLAGISCLNTTALQLLESIQPGFSTLSTNFTRARDRMLASTVTGVGNSYISSSFLEKKCRELSIEYGYISTTSFYDCVKGLPRLNTITQSIGPMIMFLQAIGSNYNSSGYVSTIHPGGFHNYYSTLGFTGGLNNVNIDSGIQSLSLDLGGFEVLDSSKMRLDINANVSVTYTNPPQPQSMVTAFSTFLHNGTRPVGIPVVVNYSNLTFAMSRFTYFLTAADLGTSLGLRHRITNFDNTNAKITVVPTSICARLINMD